MLTLTGLALLVLVIGLAAGALPSGGFWWDLLAALGYCTFTLIAFMGWDSESPAGGRRVRLHRNLAILAALIATAHAAGYLLLDATVLEYLKPSAPNYMLIGIVAWVLLLAITYSALPGPRKRHYPAFSAFRSWHRVLYLLLLATSAWHTFATDFSLANLWQVALVGLLLVGAPLLGYLARRRGTVLPVTGTPASDRQADVLPALCGLAMVGLSVAFAGLKTIA